MDRLELRAVRVKKGYAIYVRGKRPIDSLLVHTLKEEGAVQRDTHYFINKQGFKRLLNTLPIHVVRHIPNSVFQQYIFKRYNMSKYTLPKKIEDKCESEDRKDVVLTRLAPQQRFVRAYVTPQSVFKGMLMWHAAGTGKTCGAVGVASTFMEQLDPSWNVLWVSRNNLLHAPVKAMFGLTCLRNLRQEVRNKGVSLRDVRNPAHWPSLQRKYAKKLPGYRIIRFSKWVDLAKRANSPDDVTRILRGESPAHVGPRIDPFQKTLIIIDEAHNLYNTTDFADEYDARVLHKQGGIQALESAIWRSYKESGIHSCRLLLLTATPMTKSPSDLFRMINLLIPKEKNRLSLDPKHYMNSVNVITVKGKREYQTKSMGLVSYFNGDRDPRYFAMKRWGYMVKATVSDVQVEEFKKCEIMDNGQRVECLRQRDNIAKLRGKGFQFLFDAAKWNWQMLKQDIVVYAPKLDKMIRLIRKLDDQDLQTHGRLLKHVIYTDVTSQGYGSKAIASVFQAFGYVRALKFSGARSATVLEPPVLAIGPPPLAEDTRTRRKSFAVLSKTAIRVVEGDREVKQEASQGRTVATLNLFNDPKNAHGKLVRFIILDSAFKEGIDLMDVRYVHILEPPLSQSSYKQIVARAARRCGSKGLPFRHNQGWQVKIFMYQSIYPVDPVNPVDPVKGTKEDAKKGIKFKSTYKLEMQSVEGASTMHLMDQFESLAMHSATDYLLNKPILNYEPYQGFPDAIKIGSNYIGR